MKIVIASLLVAFVAMACSKAEPPPAAHSAKTPVQGLSQESPTFVDKPWTVAESSQAEIGSQRCFIGNGMLIMSSPHSVTAFGQWSLDGDWLTITEEGLSYATDILELTAESFRIRVHSPGEPVEILFRSEDPPGVRCQMGSPSKPASPP